MNENIIEIENILKEYDVKFEKSKTRINVDEFVMGNIVFVRERSNFGQGEVFITTLNNPEFTIKVVRGNIDNCRRFIEKYSNPNDKNVIEDVVITSKARLIQELINIGFETIKEVETVEYMLIRGDFNVCIGIGGFTVRYKDQFIAGEICDTMIDEAIAFIHKNANKEINIDTHPYANLEPVNPAIKREELPDGYIYLGDTSKSVSDSLYNAFEDKKDEDIRNMLLEDNDVEHISHSEVVMIADAFSKYGVVNVMQQVYDHNQIRADITKQMLESVKKES